MDHNTPALQGVWYFVMIHMSVSKRELNRGHLGCSSMCFTVDHRMEDFRFQSKKHGINRICNTVTDGTQVFCSDSCEEDLWDQWSIREASQCQAWSGVDRSSMIITVCYAEMRVLKPSYLRCFQSFSLYGSQTVELLRYALFVCWHLTIISQGYFIFRAGWFVTTIFRARFCRYPMELTLDERWATVTLLPEDWKKQEGWL